MTRLNYLEAFFLSNVYDESFSKFARRLCFNFMGQSRLLLLDDLICLDTYIYTVEPLNRRKWSLVGKPDRGITRRLTYGHNFMPLCMIVAIGFT